MAEDEDEDLDPWDPYGEDADPLVNAPDTPPLEGVTDGH
jgi:hypothetical protein